jgi:hypothetical protein
MVREAPLASLAIAFMLGVTFSRSGSKSPGFAKSRKNFMSIDDRHRDKNGEMSRKHGNPLVGTLRKIYGPSFAAGEPDTAKLQDVLAKLHETSLTQLLEDHSVGNLDGKVRQAALD